MGKQLSVPTENWYLTTKASDHFAKVSEKTNHTAKKIFESYKEKYGNIETAIEQFNFDYRERNYPLKQPQTAKSTIGYFSPLGTSTLLMLAYTTPFHKRVQNKMNKRIIDRLNPSLLNMPMAATFIKAKRPIIAQEVSRGIRLVYEIIHAKLYRKKPSLGWFNYEHLYDSNTLKEIVDSLECRIWDKTKMIDTINTNRSNNIDAGSTLDMLCRIKTVDYYLALSGKKDI
jgi:hypothetical protein